MPLPLPNLDTRRWADLVEEGRALIPRYAPQWSDHNVHDPGITLIELFAWLTEALIYQTNRIPQRHRRKFLQLIGFAPRSLQAARAVLRFALKSGLSPVKLPEGVSLFADTSGGQIPFRLLTDLTVIDTEIAVVQSSFLRSFDGKKVFMVHTRAVGGHFDFKLWEDARSFPLPTDPEEQPALYLGVAKALPTGQPVSLWLRFAGPANDSAERQRLLNETQAAHAACRPLYSSPQCLPLEVSDRWCLAESSISSPKPSTAISPVPVHHSIRTVWDYWDGSTWQPLDETLNHVIDDTRGFTLDGSVTVTLPTPMGSAPFGLVKDPQYYLRARLIAGPLDYLPTVLNVEINAVEAEQATPVRGRFVVRPGVLPTLGQEPVVGQLGHLDLDLDKDGSVTKLAFTRSGNGPVVRVIAYEPAKPLVPGALTVTLLVVGRGTGFPGLKIAVPSAPVVPNSLNVWIISNGKLEQWSMRPDFDASGRTDAHFVLAAMSGEIGFGDGERGRVVPMDAAILASFDRTSAQNGNVPAGVSWRLTGVDDDVNQAFMGADPKTVADMFCEVNNPVSATGGADEEDLEHAAGRAVEDVWAHERLLDFCEASESPQTLDGLPRQSVLARRAPPRATTLIDYERLALDVPGAPVARARAWAGLDPGFPCLKAPGTVVVVVVPWSPAKQPFASAALCDAVLQYLNRRRLVGTRLLVVGPEYLKVTVRATIALRAGTQSERALKDVHAALDRFLDPLSGGPNGRGWPFGRDVYRSEILHVIDGVAGVDHVEHLELVGQRVEDSYSQGIPGVDHTNSSRSVGQTNVPQCGNLCVGPQMLVTPGIHILQQTESIHSARGAHACPQS